MSPLASMLLGVAHRWRLVVGVSVGLSLGASVWALGWRPPPVYHAPAKLWVSPAHRPLLLASLNSRGFASRAGVRGAVRAEIL